MSQVANHVRSNLRSLGNEEARLLLDVVSRGTTNVTSRDAASILGDSEKARSTVKRLLAKGWLQSVGGGRYVVLPPNWGAEKLEDFDLYVLASASVANGYIGWWAAASRHSFTTQVPNELTVATDRQVAPRGLQGYTVRYVKLATRKFFGWQTMKSGDRSFRISSPAKTLVDCADRPELCGGPGELATIASGATRSVETSDLVETVIRHGSVSVAQRLGYLLDLAAPTYLDEPSRTRLHAFIPSSARSVFGRPQKALDDIGYCSEWGLYVHLSETELTAELDRHTYGTRP